MNKKLALYLVEIVAVLCVLTFGNAVSEKVMTKKQIFYISNASTFKNPIDEAYWDFHTGQLKGLPEAAKRGYEVGYSVSWQKEFYHVGDLFYQAIKNERDREKLVDYVKSIQLMSRTRSEFFNLDFERAIRDPEDEPSYGNWYYASYSLTMCDVYRNETLELIRKYEMYVSAPYRYTAVEFVEEDGLREEYIPEYFRINED